MTPIPDLIQKQPCWSIVIRNDEIRVPIVINITKRCPTTHLQLRKLRINNLNKTPLSRIVKELIRLAQRKRIFLLHQLRQQLHRSIRNKEIEPPIVVIIKEERPETREAT